METDGFGLEKIECKYCGNYTAHFETKMCYRCFELENQIIYNKDITIKIMKSVWGVEIIDKQKSD